MRKSASDLIRITAPAALALGFVATPAMAVTNYVLDNPNQWGNATDSEFPPQGDTTTSTTRSGSWVSNTDGQQLIYVQGGGDTTNPDYADSANGNNPQLLFDSVNDDPDNDAAYTQVEVGEIASVAWDTNKDSSSTASGHWFFNIFTKDDGDGGGSYNLNFALSNESPDSGSYSENNWNTLYASQDGNAPSDAQSDSQEVVVYDHQRVTEASGTYPAKTFEDWADDTDAPDWWNNEIKYAAFATGTGYNDGSNTFTSNLDNLQFDYDTDSASDEVTMDLEAVPEPAGVMAGLVGFGWLAFRRRAARGDEAEQTT